MSRGTVALDRFMVLVVGVLLLGAGLSGVFWWRGDLGPHIALDLTPVLRLTRQSWWPWATAAVGIVLVLLGLRWLLAHLPSRGVTTMRLDGSAASGRLSAQVRPVAQAAAEVLQECDGVRRAQGTVQRDRGQLVATLTAVIEPRADLRAVARAADDVSADLRTVLQREDLTCRVTLQVARRGRALSRAH